MLDPVASQSQYESSGLLREKNNKRRNGAKKEIQGAKARQRRNLETTIGRSPRKKQTGLFKPSIKNHQKAKGGAKPICLLHLSVCLN